MPTFLEKYVKVSKNEVATIMIVVTIVAMIGTVFTGFLSQYIGRIKTLTIFAAVAYNTCSSTGLWPISYYKH